ncbi:hypothetical protein [Pleurocapsa sp. FMAR1]|uniref:hypothetical protein n=1 Tax=Pleurocapsa sp. FMAR1 TaxID=3040204 RepID=UPI0029C66D63|nr:hypothetical protein [Pleurocapsa sp. FMAR1]
MFKIGDLVQHKTTGKIGKIVGYGCRVGDDYNLTTLKVELRSYSSCPIQPIAEDLFDRWQALPDRQIKILACTLPRFSKSSLCEVA